VYGNITTLGMFSLRCTSSILQSIQKRLCHLSPGSYELKLRKMILRHQPYYAAATDRFLWLFLATAVIKLGTGNSNLATAVMLKPETEN
jgi:hypothetical protein